MQSLPENNSAHLIERLSETLSGWIAAAPTRPDAADVEAALSEVGSNTFIEEIDAAIRSLRETLGTDDDPFDALCNLFNAIEATRGNASVTTTDTDIEQPSDDAVECEQNTTEIAPPTLIAPSDINSAAEQPSNDDTQIQPPTLIAPSDLAAIPDEPGTQEDPGVESSAPTDAPANNVDESIEEVTDLESATFDPDAIVAEGRDAHEEAEGVNDIDGFSKALARLADDFDRLEQELIEEAAATLPDDIAADEAAADAAVIEPDAAPIDEPGVAEAEDETEPTSDDESVTDAADPAPPAEAAEAEASTPTELDPVDFGESAPAAPTELDPADFGESAPAAPTELDPADFGESAPAAPTELDPADFGESAPAAPTELDPADFGESAPAAPMELDPASFEEGESGDAFEPTMVDDETISDISTDEEWGSKPIHLEEDQIESLQFAVTEIIEANEQLKSFADDFRQVLGSSEAADQLHSLGEKMVQVLEPYGFSCLQRVCRLVLLTSKGATKATPAMTPELSVRFRAIVSLVEQMAVGIQCGMEMIWPLRKFERRFGILCYGLTLQPELVGWHDDEPDKVLELDGVMDSADDVPQVDGYDAVEGDEAFSAAANEAEQEAAEEDVANQNQAGGYVRVASRQILDIVSVGRNLVMGKNRLIGARDTIAHGDKSAGLEQLDSICVELDRLTGELQTALMSLHTTNVGSLFQKYDRTVRDIARLKDKEATLVVSTPEVEIDRGAGDRLADLINLVLRYFVGSLIQTPAEREASGLPSSATVEIAAEHQGTQIAISLTCDSPAPEPVEIRLQAPDVPGIEQMHEDELIQLLIDPASNLGALGGLQEAADIAGVSCGIRVNDRRQLEVSVTIPVESAVVRAMMVELGSERYLLPLGAIVEVVKQSESLESSINGEPVVRIRDNVLGMLDLRQALGTHEPMASADGESEPRRGVAVVVTSGARTAAVAVDRVLGQRDVVVERLDVESQARGLFSGASIRDDGGVSLILDVGAVLDRASA
ncbi:MAG: chemotaxis protein CheW [Planctomycetota bacterium]